MNLNIFSDLQKMQGAFKTEKMLHITGIDFLIVCISSIYCVLEAHFLMSLLSHQQFNA